MDAEFKAKWVAALRSGEYKQTTKTLRRADGGYCCLGVACDLYDPEGWRFNADIGGGIWEYVTEDGAVSEEALPITVIDAIALDDVQDVLIDMNDGGVSFEEIADYIEEHL